MLLLCHESAKCGGRRAYLPRYTCIHSQLASLSSSWEMSSRSIYGGRELQHNSSVVMSYLVPPRLPSMTTVYISLS